MALNDTSAVCFVCARSVEGHMEAWCNTCGNLYHLNSRADLPGDDCGQVWISEEHLSLQFACNACLNPPKPDVNLDDVVDLAEAAAASGLSERALADSATEGKVKHRKTGSGVLLFRLGDVMEFARERE